MSCAYIAPRPIPGRDRPVRWTEEVDRNLGVVLVSTRVREKVVNLQDFGREFAYDRENERHRGRVEMFEGEEDLGGFRETAGPNCSPVRTESLDWRKKGSNSSLTARSRKVNNALFRCPKFRRPSRPHRPDSRSWFLQRWFCRSALSTILSPKVPGQSHPYTSTFQLQNPPASLATDDHVVSVKRLQAKSTTFRTYTRPSTPTFRVSTSKFISFFGRHKQPCRFRKRVLRSHRSRRALFGTYMMTAKTRSSMIESKFSAPDWSPPLGAATEQEGCRALAPERLVSRLRLIDSHHRFRSGLVDRSPHIFKIHPL